MMNRSIAFVACVALAAVVITLGGCTPTAGLRGHWSFDEGTGTVAKNAVGRVDGKVPAALKWVDGKKGKAILFNGKEFVVIKYCPCFNASQYTIAAWTKLKNTGDHHYIAWRAGPVFPDDDKTRRLDLWTDLDGTVSGIVHDEEGLEDLRLDGKTNIADDKWHHVALTYCGKVVTLYVDGKKEAEVKPNAPLAKNEHDLWIGGRPGGVVATGIIDEVRFYKRALSSLEVGALAGEK